MQNIIKPLLLSSAILCPSVFAGSGVGIIPSYLTDNFSNFRSYIYMSNITQAPINVTVTLYNQDGNVVKDNGDNPTAGYLRAFDYVYYSEVNTHGTATFTIAANSTSQLQLESTHYGVGYGKIEWEQSGTSLSQAMVAHMRTYRVKSGVESAYSTHINNGTPF